MVVHEGQTGGFGDVAELNGRGLPPLRRRGAKAPPDVRRRDQYQPDDRCGSVSRNVHEVPPLTFLLPA
jgi:hypothetical protein